MPKPSRMSPALKKWFGDSQVSYPNGEPIVVYHGTAGPKFCSFKKKTAYRQDESGEKEKITSQAFYFTDDKDTAKAFAYNRKKVLENLEGKKAEGRTEAFYLKAENVFDLTINADTEMKMIADGWAPYFNRGALNPYTIRELADLAGVDADDFESWDDVQRLLDDGAIIEELKVAGYDGVKLRESNGAVSYAVFDPSQIKAVYNEGTFDPDSDDIYKSTSRVRAHPRRTGRGVIT